MELKVSSSKLRDVSPSDCISDSEEKEFSDDNDDDRNHKHRRRDMSESSEKDVSEQAFSRPFRKHYKPFKNGHPDSQSSEGWKGFNNVPMEKDLSSTFDRKRPGFSTLSRAPLDLNQRIRAPQSFLGDTGPGRGRGRDSWNRNDFQFSSVDAAPQMVHRGSFPPNLFSGRGVPNVSNTQVAPWNSFGFTPGFPNGGMDALHSLGLPGSLRPPINPSLNMGIPRQRCLDFEERGFCLRGDMCPMEHGVNRIVVEDVQSLSQFNLPVSLPSAHLLGAPTGPGSTPSFTAPSSTSMNSKVLRQSNKPEMVDIGLGLSSPFSGPSDANGADFYDPDQPLLNNDCTEPSSQLLTLNSSKMDESDSLMDENSHGHSHTGFGDASDIGSQSTRFSAWGRGRSSKSRPEVKKETNSTVKFSDQLANPLNDDQEVLANVQGTVHKDKPTTTEDINFKSKTSRKPSQKALRTLFVNGIPEKNNRKDALLLHFKKFGEVIDIYMPLNSQRAFIQFSRREEAEAALKSPDAVMGNRFIKLWWANRDNIPDDGTSSHPHVDFQGKDRVRSALSKVSSTNSSDVPMPANVPKPVVTSQPAAPQPSQKKLENLEILKEELRKKQEILDQKRNEFRLQLRKLEKQASGLKNEEGAEQPMKRHKAGTTIDFAKAGTTIDFAKAGTTIDFAKATTRSPSDPGTSAASPKVERVSDNKKYVDDVTHRSNTTSALPTQETTSLKQSIRPSPSAINHFSLNRFKLDNRPTTFKLIPPLPAGLANIPALKGHFSSYGDLSRVELQEQQITGRRNGSETFKYCEARIVFNSRPSAENAFKNGKCWQGHNLQFTWLTSNDSPSLVPEESVDANVLHEDYIPNDVAPTKVVSGNGKSDTESFIDQVEPDIECQVDDSNILVEEEPHKDEGNDARTNTLVEKESPKDDNEATTNTSVEKESQKDDGNDGRTNTLVEKESPNDDNEARTDTLVEKESQKDDGNGARTDTLVEKESPKDDNEDDNEARTDTLVEKGSQKDDGNDARTNTLVEKESPKDDNEARTHTLVEKGSQKDDGDDGRTNTLVEKESPKEDNEARTDTLVEKGLQKDDGVVGRMVEKESPKDDNEDGNEARTDTLVEKGSQKHDGNDARANTLVKKESPKDDDEARTS